MPQSIDCTNALFMKLLLNTVLVQYVQLPVQAHLQLAFVTDCRLTHRAIRLTNKVEMQIVRCRVRTEQYLFDVAYVYSKAWFLKFPA